MPLSPDEVDADARFEEGRRAAHIAAKVDGQTIELKPYGQTSPENYAYTHHWVRGWNAGYEELHDEATAAR